MNIVYRGDDGRTVSLGKTNELRHWKYIKKIPEGKGFRYFYSWDEYRAYLADPAAELQKAGQKASDQLQSAGRRAGQEIKTAKKSTQKYIAKGRKSVENAIKSADRSKMTVSGVRKANAQRSPSLKQRMNEFAKNVSQKWNAGTEAVKETAEKGKKWIKNLFAEKPRPRDKEDEAIKEQYKYVAKKKINGKYRYFYSQDELDAYNKRKEYQKNEPDYLKKLKHSEDPYTKEEDAMLVNPNFGKSRNTDWYNNCAECSAIYELRRRGYDVESNGISGQPNSNFLPFQIKETIDMYKYNTEGRFERFYENPNIQNVEPTKDYSDKDTAKAIEREILKNPPGSRGDLSVQWKESEGGGGHSMVWEIDEKGKVHIIDAQVSGYGNRVEYDLNELSKKIDNSSRRVTDPRKSYTTVTRTDNLELKKDITKICKNSSDRKKQKPADQKIVVPDGNTVSYEKMTDEERNTRYPTLSEKEQKKK